MVTRSSDGNGTVEGSGIPGSLLDSASPRAILTTHRGVWLSRVGWGWKDLQQGWIQAGRTGILEKEPAETWTCLQPCTPTRTQLSPSTAHCTAEPSTCSQAMRSCLGQVASSPRTLLLEFCTPKSPS